MIKFVAFRYFYTSKPRNINWVIKMASSGRPQKEKTERIAQEAIDSVLSLWADKNEKLDFIEIHRALVKKGIVQNKNYHYKTDRILKRLINMDVIEKHSRGQYTPKIGPEKFQLFEQLGRIRKNEEMASFKIGGTFWIKAELHLLGFPEKAMDYSYVKAAMEILGTRIAELFTALEELSMIAQTRGKKGHLPPEIIRELVVELPAYYLGSRAGLDGDGLTEKELVTVYSKMLQALPQQASDDSEWQSDTLKDHILKTFSTLTTYAFQVKNDRNLEDDRKRKKFALIVTQPEWYIDEEGYEHREILDEIRWSAAKKEASFKIAQRLLIFDQANVMKVLHTRGLQYLGPQLHDVEQLYQQLVASREIAHDLRLIIDYAYKDKEIIAQEKGRNYSRFIKHHLKNLQTKADKFTGEHGTKTLVTQMPLYNVFGGPTPEKEEAVKLMLPQLSIELIHEWLLEGDSTVQDMARKAIEDMKEALDEEATKK